MSKKVWYRQFDLQSGDAFLTCWLEDDPRLKVGVMVTLEFYGKAYWKINARSRFKRAGNQRQQWKVGGLP